MIALSKSAQWSRSDIRAMTPQEFESYLKAAETVEKRIHGGKK